MNLIELRDNVLCGWFKQCKGETYEEGKTPSVQISLGRDMTAEEIKTRLEANIDNAKTSLTHAVDAAEERGDLSGQAAAEARRDISYIDGTTAEHPLGSQAEFADYTYDMQLAVDRLTLMTDSLADTLGTRYALQLHMAEQATGKAQQNLDHLKEQGLPETGSRPGLVAQLTEI